MKIDANALALPSKEVSNDDVLSLVGKYSEPFLGTTETSRMLRLMDRLLDKCGTKTRYWLDEHETSLDVTLHACREVLDTIDNPQSIDLIISASVYAELTEPATANLIAQQLGLNDTECVDMKEACDGWAKALKFAHALLASGMYQRIMVVNGEFSMRPRYAINPNLFAVTNHEQIEHRFPAYTVGEGATATILSASDSEWTFHNITRNDLVDLCTVTPPWYDMDKRTSEKFAPDGPGLFTSWAMELSQKGIPLAVQTFRESGIEPSNVDILFTHASSTRDWKEIAGEIGLSQKLFDVHPDIGNLVSASVPAAMALAKENGRLKRGDHMAILIGSAGMTFSAMETTY